MVTQEQLDADLSAVQDAQSKYDADKAAFDAVQPHLTVLSEIEQLAATCSDDVKAGFEALVAKARALL